MPALQEFIVQEDLGPVRQLQENIRKVPVELVGLFGRDRHPGRAVEELFDGLFAALPATIRFSGFWTDRNLRKNLEKLDAFIQGRGLKTAEDPVYAFYNPPWALPFFRRNEILYDLQSDQPAGTHS